MKKGGISATSIDIDVALQVAELNRQKRSVTIWRQLQQLLWLLVVPERLLLEVLVRQQVQRESLLLELSWLEQQRRIRLKHSQKLLFRMSCILKKQFRKSCIQKMCRKSYILKKQFRKSCIQKMCRKSYILKKQFHMSCIQKMCRKSYIL